MTTYNVATVRISEPVDLVTAAESLGNALFRGQGSDEWRLESTFERDAKNFNVPSKSRWERENKMLSLFKERAHLYKKEVEYLKSEFEWWSLIRHYGGSSRLLDVTSSYLVAAYFALCDSQGKDAAIWAFRTDAITPEEDSINYTEIDELFRKDSKPELVIARPNRLNIRLHYQSGKFFVPSSVIDSLEKQVGDKFDTEIDKEIKPYEEYESIHDVKNNIRHRIWKFVIPRTAHSNMFRFISRCNVRAYTLLPSMEGLAISLKEIMRGYD